jgi:hypothetical protein
MTTATAVAETIDLPDGRRLQVFADGREVVLGVARRYPHPIAGCEWLGAHPRPRVVRRRPPPAAAPLRFRVLPDARDFASHRPRTEAARRANALLESLLQPSQLEDWRRSGRFWVDTPRGPVQLGELYALVHRPDDEPGVERILCVVPHGHTELPLADIWTNLLLVLAVEPDQFFRVAIERGRRRVRGLVR